MFRQNFFSAFANLPWFTKQALRNAAEKYALPAATLNTYIQRSLQDESLIALKRGWYVTGGYFAAHRQELGYGFALSNQLLRPSYVSLESALQLHGILAEANHAVTTAVTTSTPRKFSNRLGLFTYRHRHPAGFNGYEVIPLQGWDCLIATPAKAVLDYLYYRLPREALRDTHQLVSLAEEFRLDLERLGTAEYDQLIQWLSEV